MSTKAMTKEQIKNSLESKLIRYFGVTPDEATPEQIYKAVVYSVKDILQQKRGEFREKTKKSREPNPERMLVSSSCVG